VTNRPKILVIGLDAFEPKLWQRWAAEGSLPALGGLLSEATWGPVENAPGIYGGSAWSSFATGVSPGVHGRFCRRQAPRGQYVDRVHRPDEVGGTPFWETLGEAGYRVAVLDVPHTCPARPINGIQLVDWATHDPYYVPACSAPPELVADLELVAPAPEPDPCERVPLEREALVALRRQILERVVRKGAITLHCLDREDWDLFVSVFGEAHCTGHRFWFLHDITHPMHSRELAAEIGDVVHEVYAAIDGAIARILARTGPETHVFVLSSHGMGPVSTGEAIVFDEILRRLGGGPSDGSRSAFASLKRAWYALPRRLRDAAPLRRLLEISSARLRSSLLFPERERRPFFAIPTDPFAGAVRVNLAGRECHGIVDPRDYGALCQRLQRDLLEIVIDGTGEQWIERLVVSREVFSGPRVDELPDLIVEWKRVPPVRAVRSPKIGTIRIPEIVWRSGDHLGEGFFAARGPGVVPGPIEGPVSIRDFAPTFAAILAATLPGIEGRAIGRVVRRA
jgi:predicted AlkP superfamily phosphohydrolase/phosphomutase